MSAYVTIPRETAVRMAADYRISSTDPTVRATEAERQTYRQWADLLDPPALPLTLAQEVLVDWIVRNGEGRDTAVAKVRNEEWPTATKTATAVLNLAARDPLRLLAEHGTPLTEEPPGGTLVAVHDRFGWEVAWRGSTEWFTAGHGPWKWGDLTDSTTVYRLGGAS